MKSKDFYKLTAWKWFSKYVLLHYSKDGVVQCATCGSWKQCNDPKMHLGHLIKVFESGAKTNFNTAFDQRNVLPQCYQCNVLNGGRELRMLEAVEHRFGVGTYDKLKSAAKEPYFGLKLDLKELSDRYRNKFNSLVQVKGNPWS